MSNQTPVSVIQALAPAFAAGFALQHMLEILDPILSLFLKNGYKKPVLGAISFLIGLALAFGAKLQVLHSLDNSITNSTIDGIATALIISAGTEGFNSIMKFLGYAKDSKKADAGSAIKSATDGANPRPPEAGVS